MLNSFPFDVCFSPLPVDFNNQPNGVPHFYFPVHQNSITITVSYNHSSEFHFKSLHFVILSLMELQHFIENPMILFTKNTVHRINYNFYL